ncbi:MAG: hypothetical protein ACI4ES_12270 [Roseburia sp.]
MNEKQQQWLNDKIEFMKKQIEANWPLTEEAWEQVAEYIEKVVNLSKGNAEVRTALLRVAEHYTIKEEQEKKCIRKAN